MVSKVSATALNKMSYTTALFCKCDVTQLRGDREHDVVILDRQEVGLAGFEPAFGGNTLALWTVPIATGVISDLDLAHSLRIARRDRRAPLCGSARSPT